VDELTKADHMDRVPFEVTFGGRVFKIRPQGNRFMARWMPRCVRTVQALMKLQAGGGIEAGDDVSAALAINADALEQGGELAVQVMDLVFDYAGFAPEDAAWIDLNAAQDEFQAALQTIMEHANPQKPPVVTTPAGASVN
jgi:hypothetical protein